MPYKLHLSLLFVLCGVFSTGCDNLFGTKSDGTTSEIFEAGRREPGLINEVEYVPLFPFFGLGGDGGPLEAPTDVYVGYDELIYITDGRGLSVLDRSGRPATFVPIPGGATNVVQDRRFDLYVTARRDTTLNGRVWNLPVVLHYTDLTAGFPTLSNIIWHPFDDDSRKFNRPDPIDSDEEVSFTGVAVLYNNDIYVSRRGPVNDRTSVILPHNTVMEFTPEGVNVQSIVALNPTLESLRSAINPSDIITFVQPPQRNNFPAEKHFILAQSPYPDGVAQSGGAKDSLRFAVLSIRAIETPDGIEFRPDTEKLQVAANTDRGDGFLYDEFKFSNPTGLAFAGDGTNYIFVTDSGKDSLFIFTGLGIEGVAGPPGSSSTTPVVVSFGGNGDGAMQFRDPEGVGYADRIVYVADKGNNRIARFRLNTDFE